MCLIVLAINQHPEVPFVLIANRDEFRDRDAHTAHFWQSQPSVLAGRDQLAGGTWLGAHRDGRFAALTNIRAAQPLADGAPSRGTLITDFLCSGLSPKTWLTLHRQEFPKFSGFNLLLGNPDAVWFANNADAAPRKLDHGIYGLSNATLDTPWPKVNDSKMQLRRLLQQSTRPATTEYLKLLRGSQRTYKKRNEALAEIFVNWPDYGTRCSTVIQRDTLGNMLFTEQTWDSGGEPQEIVSVQLPPIFV